MFNYNRVLNATTGDRYTITQAILKDDELDMTPNGGNSYEISLDPISIEGKPIDGVTLHVHNNGYVAMLTKNLDPAGATHEVVEGGYTISREELRDAMIEGTLLIVTMED